MIAEKTTLSDGAQNMLLHIARVRPLPKPFPSEIDGRRYLAELLFGGFIDAVAEGQFEPTEIGRVEARGLVPCETCNGYGWHPADGGSHPCPDCGTASKTQTAQAPKQEASEVPK